MAQEAIWLGTMFLIFNNAASKTLDIFGGVGDFIHQQIMVLHHLGYGSEQIPDSE